MKPAVVVVALLVLAACGKENSGDPGDFSVAADGEVTFCSCANEPVQSGAKAKACAALMESVPQQEAVTRIMECREQLAVPADGPDLCFCVRTLSQDPEIRVACEALLPDNPSREEVARITLACQ